MPHSSAENCKLLHSVVVELVRPDYWYGYMRGLRRAYHGEQFGTDEEHALWLALAERDTRRAQERGRGYPSTLVT